MPKTVGKYRLEKNSDTLMFMERGAQVISGTQSFQKTSLYLILNTKTLELFKDLDVHFLRNCF